MRNVLWIGGKKMKRKTYMIYCIVCLVCLSASCTVQAITYNYCHVIAIGRSQTLALNTNCDWQDVFNNPIYRGYLPNAQFGFNHVIVIIIDKNPWNGQGIHFYSHILDILLYDTTGLFIWKLPLSEYVACKAYINADADKVDIT